MGEVIPLFDKDALYHGECLECGGRWLVTKEQLEVALGCDILYSPCCKQPATITKGKRRDTKNMHSL